MASEWKNTTLEEPLDFSNGRSCPPRCESGKFTVFGSNGIIGRTTLSNSPSRTIIIGRVGSYCGSLHYSAKPCWVTDNAIKAIARDGNSPEFLRYLLQTLDLNNWRGGSGQPLLNQSTLNSIPICLPSADEQERIGNLLGTLDRRARLLADANSSLESIARAIFKSWFVDFDPVRAKAEGREPEGMDADTAALFPREFQESELGQIPRGWNIEGFDSAVDITSGGTPKTSRPEYWGGDIPWFSIVDAPSPSEVFVIETEKQITDAGLANCAARLLPIGATIISARGTVGKLAVTGVPMAINQSCYALLSRVFGTYGTFFQTGCLVDTLRQFAHGAVFSTITRDTLTAIKVVTPPKAIADSYEEAAGPLMDTILNNRKMSATLADLRDTLLPRLISGKLRVPEAEAIITKRGE
jgi:restriction endonuclease S subunit